MSTLPILFNTEMVKAILEGRKTVTRRVIKPQPNDSFDRHWETFTDESGEIIVLSAPCHPGDILYVRETWRIGAWNYDEKAIAVDYADGSSRLEWIPISDKTALIRYIRQSIEDSVRAGLPEQHWKPGQAPTRWRPSIHMPSEVARIFLRVTDVRVERLQEITDHGARLEGVGDPKVIYYNGALKCDFADLWDSTIKPENLDSYGWAANPWVWVISFERCEKPENWP